MKFRRIAPWLIAACVAVPFSAIQPVHAAGKKATPAKAKKAAPHRAKRKAAQLAPGPVVDRHGNPLVRSAAVVVQDQASGEILYEKNPDAVLPIASITKLMTAMVVLDSQLPLNVPLSVSDEDVDLLRGSRSRLPVGAVLTREDLLRLALMSSENRAASALGRHFPGGREAFVEAMNRKARLLGLTDTRFYDSTGLMAANVSSARDLAKMVAAAARYPLIREFSTTAEYEAVVNGRHQQYRNTNALVRSPGWEIDVSKTGYINEAGRCLVMHAWLNSKPVVIVLLDSVGRLTRIADATRIKRWLERAAVDRSLSVRS